MNIGHVFQGKIFLHAMSGGNRHLNFDGLNDINFHFCIGHQKNTGALTFID